MIVRHAFASRADDADGLYGRAWLRPHNIRYVRWAIRL